MGTLEIWLLFGGRSWGFDGRLIGYNCTQVSITTEEAMSFSVHIPFLPAILLWLSQMACKQRSHGGTKWGQNQSDPISLLWAITIIYCNMQMWIGVFRVSGGVNNFLNVAI